MEKTNTAKMVEALKSNLDTVNAMKAPEFGYDARSLAVAATHIETAMLWIANAAR